LLLELPSTYSVIQRAAGASQVPQSPSQVLQVSMPLQVSSPQTGGLHSTENASLQTSQMSAQQFS
jgi:hypothetical protein